MKLSKTRIGLLLALTYLAVFAVTVYLSLFDNREGCGTLFPGILTLPWSLAFETLHSGSQHDMALAMLKRLPGALVNAFIICYVFRRFDGISENRG
jgi:hypothetical protein